MFCKRKFIIIILIGFMIISFQQVYELTESIGKIAKSNTESIFLDTAKEIDYPSDGKYPRRWNNNTNISTSLDKEGGFERNENYIRKWGCNRTETPLIFIHIGKAGGSTIREALASGGKNAKNQRLSRSIKDGIFYPIDENGTHSFFVDSKRVRARPFYLERKYKLGSLPCHATTPFGLIGCIDPYQEIKGCDRLKDKNCRHVYVGHDFLGSEMRWLTLNQLEQWYSNIIGNTNEKNDSRALSQFIESVLEKNHQKKNIFDDITSKTIYGENYDDVIHPVSQALDEKAHEIVSENELHENGWASLYQSLPVLRVVILRDPFSWLVSKFFWHKLTGTCDDDYDIQWAHDYSIQYIHYLCGNDCYNADVLGLKTIDEMEKQAATNLRLSIAVVGLLDDAQNFFEMMNKRVKYIYIKRDNFRNNKSKVTDETLRCKQAFKDPLFQKTLMDRSTAIAALVRLYELGVEVNQFQREELENCPILS